MKTVLSIICLLIIFQANAQNTSSSSKLDEYMEHLEKNRKFMGSVSILFQDSIIYSNSVGMADVQLQKINNSETKFRIASLTKTYTATLILMAVEEKKLNLSDKLNKFYPKIKHADNITIEHLLKHTSGLPNFTNIKSELVWEQSYHSQKEFIKFFLNEPSSFLPGTDYQYNNTGYALLGFILEKVYKKSFAQIIQDKIAQPLGLKNTYYTFIADSEKNEALSYNIQEEYVRNARVNFSNHPASGGLASSANDVNVFVNSLFKGRLISLESLEMMLPKDKGAYGMGIKKLKSDSPEGFNHGGRIENYISSYWYFPKEQLGIVCLSNATNIDLDDVMATMVKFAYGNMPEKVNYNKTEDLSEEEFALIKGAYITNDKTESVYISSDGTYLYFQSAGLGQDYIPFLKQNDGSYKYQEITIKFDNLQKRLDLFQNGIHKQYFKK